MMGLNKKVDEKPTRQEVIERDIRGVKKKIE